jgi:hypothetical protein
MLQQHTRERSLQQTDPVVCLQELAGALLMFILTFPCTGVFGNTWTAWIVHFFFVMLVRVPLL